MPFHSYSQFFEDVLLWRALKEVENGFYIDIGAQDPDVDSVSKAFHLMGWQGVHVEPTPFYAQKLREKRVGDFVLEVALSDRTERAQMNFFAGLGISTLRHEIAKSHHEKHGFESQMVEVQVQKTSDALRPFEGRPIHWMKIDVEGFEESVIKGWNSKNIRPWVLMVEATVPGSPEPNFHAWDHLIVDAGYVFVHFDGLNRYYLSEEHLDLKPHFSLGPNYFDDIILGEDSYLCRELREQIQALKMQCVSLTNQLTQSIHDKRLADQLARQLLNQLDAGRTP